MSSKYQKDLILFPFKISLVSLDTILLEEKVRMCLIFLVLMRYAVANSLNFDCTFVVSAQCSKQFAAH